MSWLHAPLEDQSLSLLDLVAGGQVTPLLCHLIGLPLIQVTLDRLYSIPELQTALKPDPKDGNILERCSLECMNNKDLLPLLVNSDGWPSDGQRGVWGTYDNCTPADQLLTIDSIKVNKSCCLLFNLSRKQLVNCTIFFRNVNASKRTCLF